MSRAAAVPSPALVAVTLVAASLLGCEPGTELERSCGGEAVGLCGAREVAIVDSASLEPAALPVADFSMNAQIRVALSRCEDAPAEHEVELSALVPGAGGPDAGVQLMSLLTLRPGQDGDPPGDDVIEVEVINPLLATLPAETDITLRFTARSTTPGGCTSGFLELPYRTGPRRE